MRREENARIRKLEERNEDLRGALEEALDAIRRGDRERALEILEPFDIRSENVS